MLNPMSRSGRAGTAWLRSARLCLAAAVLAGGLAALAPAAHADDGERRGPRFEAADCAGIVPEGVTITAEAGSGVECGYVRVPQHYARPDGASFRLAVVRLKSTGDQPAPDPLVMLQGGPGGSTIQSYTAQFLRGGSAELAAIRQARDIVLFDQRGTGASEPHLQCANCRGWMRTRWSGT